MPFGKRNSLGQVVEAKLPEREINIRYLNGESGIKLAKEYGVTPHTIYRRVRKYKIKIRRTSQRKELPTQQIIDRYKGGESAVPIANSLNCGVAAIYYHLKKNGIERRKSSEYHIGENNWNWKGGRAYHTGGYILIRKPNHPNANSQGYVPEHRLVMEKKVGRHLKRKEAVHHINGIREDNRPENLELYQNNSEHHKTLHIYPKKMQILIDKLRCKFSLKEIYKHLKSMEVI